MQTCMFCMHSLIDGIPSSSATFLKCDSMKFEKLHTNFYSRSVQFLRIFRPCFFSDEMWSILNVGHWSLFGISVVPSAVSSPAVIKQCVSSHVGLCHSTCDLPPAYHHSCRPEHVVCMVEKVVL